MASTDTVRTEIKLPAIDIGLNITAVNNAAGALNSLSSQLKGVNENAEATSNRLKAIQVVIAGIAIEKTLEFGKAFIAAASAVQNADTRMAAWAGGQKNASAIMEKLNADLGASGIKLDTLSNAFVKLSAAGLNSKQATETIENLVNGIAAVGGGDLDSKLDAAATSFQRFAAKGVVSTRELNAIITETGLTVKDMADAIGISVTQFYNELKDKTLGATTLLDAFNKAAEQKFGGFVTLLGSTVGGALNKFQNDVTIALGSLGSKTNLDANIVAVIQNLDAAVQHFLASISNQDIANFFKFLQDMVPVAIDVGELIYTIAVAVLHLADISGQFLSMLPSDAVEFGIVGYVLMGKKGAVLLGLLGAAAGKLADLGAQVKSIAAQYNSLQPSQDASGSSSRYQTVLNSLNKQDPNSPIANMFSAMTYWGAAQFGDLENAVTPKIKGIVDDLSGILKLGDGKNTAAMRLIGTPEQIAAIEAELKKLQNMKLGGGGISPTPNLGKDISGQLASVQNAFQNTLNSTTGKDTLLEMQNDGDKLGQAIQEIKDKTLQWSDALNTAAVNVAKSKLPHDVIKSDLAQIESLQAKINVDTANAIVLATKLVELKNQEVGIAQKIAQAQLQSTQYDLNSKNRQLTGSAGQQLLGGTSAAALQDSVDKQVMQYKQQILGYEQQINQLQQQELQDPGNASQYDATIAGLQKTIDLTKQLAQVTTTSTQMMADFYQQLGTTLEDDIGSGISGVIQGTETMGQAAQKVFADMVDAAVKYIIKLVLMDALQSVGGFADGGIFGGSITAFANGGIPVPNGNNTTKFADGGLTNGPTLFGLMGEAGTEAIMPLTRIGGKLGVRATGNGGGNNYHIHVNAVDTQTGMEFISKNIANIDNHLKHRQMLNKKAR